MDRQLIYTGEVPRTLDILSIQRQAMVAQGYATETVAGTAPVAVGFGIVPTIPASLSFSVDRGCLSALQVIDATAFSNLPAASEPLVKTGINIDPTPFTIAPPTAAGQQQVFLIQAALVELDDTPAVLPYYNAANPAQGWGGPNNTGLQQNTRRTDRVVLQAKPGVPANAGTQQPPAADPGYVPLWTITVANGATAITAANVAMASNGPFLGFNLSSLATNLDIAAAAYGIAAPINDVNVLRRLLLAVQGAAAAAAGGPFVRQGGGPGELGNVLNLGWSGSDLRLAVDGADQGALALESWVANAVTAALANRAYQRTASAPFTAPGVFSWTCPAGVYWIDECVIVGGGGGGSNCNTSTGVSGDLSGGGGGGGGISISTGLAVVPGTIYQGNNGAGGAPQSDGGDTQFASQVARGGKGSNFAGLAISGGGLGGVSSGGNRLNYQGSDGDDGQSFGNIYGGNGASGYLGAGAGRAGLHGGFGGGSPGAGGGGAYDDGNGTGAVYQGGAGASGAVYFTYRVPA